MYGSFLSALRTFPTFDSKWWTLKLCASMIYRNAMHAYCDYHNSWWVVIKERSKMDQRPPTPTLWKLMNFNMYLLFICKCCLALTRLCLAFNFTGGNFTGDASYYSHCIWVWVLSNDQLASGFICVSYVWTCPLSTVVIFLIAGIQFN